ncbi:unnamed protein product [Caenorhabditis auriculariae]|uniref:Uncharacterized protein n=1 Tax=Caenorhabditis auriculariae TaxID=2777116 RepID=A0A8S1H5Y3_9PELO|nr:unnamed protein product [Caenorhabditis auriculariae]
MCAPPHKITARENSPEWRQVLGGKNNDVIIPFFFRSGRWGPGWKFPNSAASKAIYGTRSPNKQVASFFERTDGMEQKIVTFFIECPVQCRPRSTTSSGIHPVTSVDLKPSPLAPFDSPLFGLETLQSWEVLHAFSK